MGGWGGGGGGAEVIYETFEYKKVEHDIYSLDTKEKLSGVKNKIVMTIPQLKSGIELHIKDLNVISHALLSVLSSIYRNI